MELNLTNRILNCLDFIFTCSLLAFRLLRYGYTYRRIYLGEGKWTLLDVKDYYRLRIFKWIVYGNGHNLYAIRLRFADTNKTSTVYMHREIMNPPAGLVVDHRNCDGLDNRRSNLRFATHAQNTRNRRKKKNGVSQFRGVWFYKGKWGSQIKGQGKRIYLGRFDNEIDAARAYDKAALEYHKEFARLNFPESATKTPGH
jgi:hypothetical protein